MPDALPTDAAVAALAPGGTLRAAINLSNFLLVTGTTADGAPDGVSPDLARELARRLGVAIELVPYPTPGELADAVATGAWDVGNIGAEPQRAPSRSRSPPRTARSRPPTSCRRARRSRRSPTSTVRACGSPAPPRAAYDLWLERNLRHAELVHAPGLDASYDLFVTAGLDALAGLRPRLEADRERLAGARVLDGRFTAVQQAIGTPRDRDPAGIAYLESFVADAKTSGLVAALIARHGVTGLTVAA